MRVLPPLPQLPLCRAQPPLSRASQPAPPQNLLLWRCSSVLRTLARHAQPCALTPACAAPLPAHPTRPPADDVKQKLVEQGVYDPTLPKPGDIVHLDYRSPEAIAAASHPDETRPLRVVQWNIERGYELDAVKTTLAELDADILLLQEIDVGCDRSDNRDVGTPPPHANASLRPASARITSAARAVSKLSQTPRALTARAPCRRRDRGGAADELRVCVRVHGAAESCARAHGAGRRRARQCGAHAPQR